MDCWNAVVTLMVYFTVMNWLCWAAIAGVLWWILERRSPVPTSVVGKVAPDEYDDDTLVKELRRSPRSPSPKIQEVTDTLRTVTSSIGTTTDLRGMSGALMAAANDISTIINDDVNIPRAKKHELVQILANIPDFIHRVSEVKGSTSTPSDDGQKLMDILDSLK
jgi:hypothetical protein